MTKEKNDRDLFLKRLAGEEGFRIGYEQLAYLTPKWARNQAGKVGRLILPDGPGFFVATKRESSLVMDSVSKIAEYEINNQLSEALNREYPDTKGAGVILLGPEQRVFLHYERIKILRRAAELCKDWGLK